MEMNKAQNKWTLGLLWIVINTITWGMYIVLAGVIGLIMWEVSEFFSGMGMYFLSDESNRLLISAIVLGVCMGTIIGYSQYYVLKRFFEVRSKRWVLATLIGITFGLSIRFVLPDPTSIRNPSLSFYQIIKVISYIIAVISWISLGVSQWVILRETFSRAEWWIVAVGLAQGIRTLISSRFSYGGENYARFSLLFFTLDGFIYGVLTLIVLFAIFKRLDTIALSE